MNDNISNSIKEVLGQTGSVIIPDFGRFTAQYKSSVIDNIQGQLNSPSMDIAFDSNVRINDGVLVDKISRDQRISIQEAQSQLDNYVKDAYHLIIQHESFSIPDIGKIYQDASGKTQFVSFNQNINLDSFGLPNVSFQPISRTQTIKTSTQEPVAKTDFVVKKNLNDSPQISTTSNIPLSDIYITSGVEEEPKILGLERSAFWRTFITTSLILSILAIIGLTRNNKNKTEVINSNIPDTSIINVPTSSEVNKNSGTIKSPAVTTTDTNMLVTESSRTLKTTKTPVTPKTEDIKVVPTEKNETPAKTVVIEEKKSAKENSATIIIGSFGNPSNIAKLRKWIINHNYEVYEQPRGDLKTIGAVVHYDTKDELNKIVAQFKERYGYEIEVKK